MRSVLISLLQSEKQEKLQKVEHDAESERLRELRRKEMIEKEKMERFAQLEKWKVMIIYLFQNLIPFRTI